MRVCVIACSLFLSIVVGTARGAPLGLTRYEEPLQAPALKLKDMRGNTHSLSDYRGKVVIINFWASWCVPCIAEMPSLQRAWEQLRREDVQVLAVNVGEKDEDLHAFSARWRAKYPVSFPLLRAVDAKAMEAWSVRAMPTSYVLSPAGEIVMRITGGYEWDDPNLLEEMRALNGG